MKITCKAGVLLAATTISIVVPFMAVAEAGKEPASWVGGTGEPLIAADAATGVATICHTQTVRVIVAANNPLGSEIKPPKAACMMAKP